MLSVLCYKQYLGFKINLWFALFRYAEYEQTKRQQHDESSSQTKLMFPETKYRNTDARQQQIVNWTVEMIIDGYLPFSFVETPAWHRFMQVCRSLIFYLYIVIVTIEAGKCNYMCIFF